jgi:hypothetical protein
MSEIMLVNPRRKKRKMSAKQRKYFGGGRRKRRRATATVTARANPRRARRRARRTVRARRNPIAAAVRRSRRRGGGGGKLKLIPSNLIGGTLVPAAIGGAGALAVDVAWGFLPLPANIKTGPLGPVAKAAAAIVLGSVASKFAGRAIGEKVTSGYLTVLAYNFARGMLQKAMPSIPLGDYDMGYVSAGLQMPDANGVSAYITHDTAAPSQVGSYINGYSNSYGDGSY